MTSMTRKERILAALGRRPVDRLPCSPFFNPLTPPQRRRYGFQFPWGPSIEEQVRYLVEQLDVEPIVPLSPGDPVPEHGVSSETTWEDDVIRKAWHTPSGDLTARIRYTELWPHGFDIPFFSDFNIAHYVEPWVKGPADVECLAHILKPGQFGADIDRLRFKALEARRLADSYELPLLASVGSGLTGLMQLCGAEQLCLMTMDDPDTVDRYLQVEHELNLALIERAVELGAAIIRRNGFYETADFYGPAMLQRFLKGRLNAEADATHSGGAVFAYTIHTGAVPILDHLASLSVDCIMHLDTGYTEAELRQINETLGHTKSFWTGPSNTFHMWSEDPRVVRDITRAVTEVFGPSGLLITASPSSHSIMPWENTLAMIDEVKRITGVNGSS